MRNFIAFLKIKKFLFPENISPLTPSLENPLYVKFLTKTNNAPIDDDGYNWKCFLCKSYFFDNFIQSLLMIVFGIALLFITIHFTDAGIMNAFFIATFIIISVFFCIGYGFLSSCFYLHMYFHYKDYVWNKEGSLSKMIKEFYM